MAFEQLDPIQGEEQIATIQGEEQIATKKHSHQNTYRPENQSA
jgi:hypothetical protein